MRQRNYYLYIMASLSRTLYTGVTNDLERRVFEHKEGTPGSFTGRDRVNRLVYDEEFIDINQAIAREKELKVSAIAPSNGPVFRCSLPSPGSRGSVPPLPR